MVAIVEIIMAISNLQIKIMKLINDLDVNGKSLVNAPSLTIQTSGKDSTKYSVQSTKSIDLSFTEAAKITKQNGDFDVDESFDHVDVRELIKRLIYGYTPPQLSMNGTDTGTHEVGSLTESTISINVVKGSRNLKSLAVSDTTALPFTLKEGTQSSKVTFNISTAQYKGYTVTLTDEKNPATVIQRSVGYDFQWRAYAGISDTIMSGATSLPLADTNKIVYNQVHGKKTFAFTITTKDQYYWFAIPKSWNVTPVVKDPNNFGLNESLNSKEVNVTNAYSKTTQYVLYYNLIRTSNNNFRITVNC